MDDLILEILTLSIPGSSGLVSARTKPTPPNFIGSIATGKYLTFWFHGSDLRNIFIVFSASGLAESKSSQHSKTIETKWVSWHFLGKKLVMR